MWHLHLNLFDGELVSGPLWAIPHGLALFSRTKIAPYANVAEGRECCVVEPGGIFDALCTE